MCAAEAFVSPWGVEPQSLEPESNILSIELRRHQSEAIWLLFDGQNYIFSGSLPNAL